MTTVIILYAVTVDNHVLAVRTYVYSVHNINIYIQHTYMRLQAGVHNERKWDTHDSTPTAVYVHIILLYGIVRISGDPVSGYIAIGTRCHHRRAQFSSVRRVVGNVHGWSKKKIHFSFTVFFFFNKSIFDNIFESYLNHRVPYILITNILTIRL